MTLDKDTFYQAIDFGDHLNTKTKEDYWRYFKEICNQNIQTLLETERSPYSTETGIHLYIKHSIEAFARKNEADEAINRKEEKQKDSKISPIDKDWKKESATTWGTNNDVKFK